METVNIHEAKTNLSKLLAKGEPFIIAKSGKPIYKAVPIEEPMREPRKLGFLADQKWVIPDDFDRWAEDEIAEMFGVKE
jgi:antitoxin (DNA-binding transcriptional repressor) of toxin-antitoxin stability system